MSGDVQPRKRKDKKRKKDELGVEEPRGTSAALGEGDVFMHSQHDHGTGGHWCAKIIFFSLLGILITLIGLIILENRGLSELDANAVESRYSGVFEGWLEDAPDDDHHDEHTLELNHHDDEEDDHVHGHDDDDHEESHEDEDDEHDQEDDDDEHDEDDDDDQDLDTAEDEDEDERSPYRSYFMGNNEDDDDDDEDKTDLDRDDDENDDEDDNQDDDDDEDQNNDDDDDDEEDDDNDDDEEQDDVENQTNEDDDNDDDGDDKDNDLAEGDDDEESVENFFGANDEDDAQDEDDDEHDEEDDDEDDEIEVEKIEKEASEEEEPISLNLSVLPEDEDDGDDSKGDDDDDDGGGDTQEDDKDNDDVSEADDDDDDDFLEGDDELPIVERYTAPAVKPLPEVEDDDEEVSSERPPDTLEEEEEYEKRQEELRREEEQASHMWLKLVVGAALLAATLSVLRRASAPRDELEDEQATREETPLTDRRMTLIPEETTPPVTPKPKPVVEEVTKKIPSIVKSAPTPKQVSEEDEEQEEREDVEVEEDKELYSDEDVEEEEMVKVKRVTKQAKEPTPEPEEDEKEEDDEVPDDVEIIEDEIEEEEDEEEEISDVDDADLLTRLEAKYGRLPEPERPGQKFSKDGGNSVEDHWPGEPVEAYWRQQLDELEEELRQGSWTTVAEKARVPELAGSARARYIAALALDKEAEAKRDNRLLSQAISAYLHLLKMNENLSDKKLKEVASRTIDRIQFRGNYLNAEPVYRLLIRRFPKDVDYRNNLTISFLTSNRGDLAEEVLKETLQLWPNDRIALAHYAFVLKTTHNKLEEAVELFEKALKGDKGPACEPRFYYHLGDALLLLGRFSEAHEVHKRGAKHGHFLSPSQRSLYNVPGLKSQPWWSIDETPYANFARALEKSWREILKEGLAAQALFEQEKEGLKERGEWSQLDLFVRGREVDGRCERTPVTCGVLRGSPAAACRRGQVKFSALAAGTHVRPHVGPTNCRLRLHLGLANTENTYLRVDQETRSWQEGKVLLFDDSFEHEVWHNGTGKRLVLIVDLWHPDLTPQQRRSLTAI